MPLRTSNSPSEPSSEGVPHIKGIAIRRLLENVEHFYGDATVRQVVQAMPDDLRHRVQYQQIISGGWYPITWLRSVHVAVREVTQSGPEVARKFGYRAATQNFTTFHRVFLAVLSPEFVLRRAARIFNLYVQRGQMKIAESRHGMARAVFRGCALFDASIWESTIGQCEAVLSLCGAKNIRMHVNDGGGDADFLDVTAYWT
jgi:hypothetical protein